MDADSESVPLRSQKLIRSYRSSTPGYITCFASVDAVEPSRLFHGGSKGSLSWFDVETGTETTLCTFNDAIEAIQYLPKRNVVCVGLSDGNVSLIDSRIKNQRKKSLISAFTDDHNPDVTPYFSSSVFCMSQDEDEVYMSVGGACTLKEEKFSTATQSLLHIASQAVVSVTEERKWEFTSSTSCIPKTLKAGVVDGEVLDAMFAFSGGSEDENEYSSLKLCNSSIAALKEVRGQPFHTVSTSGNPLVASYGNSPAVEVYSLSSFKSLFCLVPN